jgi:transglutaminase-like putative cysteine protease
MVVIRFSREFVDKFPGVYDVVRHTWVTGSIYWVIDWRYRVAVSLVPWIREQVDNPSDELRAFCDDIPTGEDYDETALNVLSAVRRQAHYVTDDRQWSIPEVWSTANDSILSLIGDCEDFAIVIYVLCRLKGIPSNRLFIMCGGVLGGGHCWVGYKPIHYPMNFVFLDWCYWFSSLPVDFRRKYYVVGKKIHSDTPNNVYFDLWFAFNEEFGVRKINEG